MTNLTRGQSFTPILAATHSGGVSLFTVGTEASPQLSALAEGGRGRAVERYPGGKSPCRSEPNDERCAAIPGPVCGGEGTSAGAGGEGYVLIHAGIHGIGDLVPADRDWRNPVAQITMRRVR